MNKIKKFLSLGLTLTLALSMMACSTTGGTSEKESNNPSSDYIPGVDESTDISQKRIIEFAYLKAGFGNKPYEELALAYMERNPDVLVKLRADPEINTNVDNQINNNVNVADIYCVRNLNQIVGYAADGLAEPLDSLLNSNFGEGYKESSNTVRSNISQTALDTCSFLGKVYSVPEYINVNGLVYNASLFEENGWEIPTNTAELEELCKKIIQETSGEVAPLIYCGSAADGYLYFAVDNWLTQYAGIQNLDDFYKYDNPEMFAPGSRISQGKLLAHETLYKLFKDIEVGGYAMNASMSMDHHMAQGHLVAGRAAMMLNGSWFENEMATVLAEYPDLDLGMMPLPELTNESGSVVHAEGYTTVDGKRVLDGDYGAYYFVPTNSKNKADALDFLKFLNSDEASIIWTKYTNAPRPLNYNLDSTTEDYANISNFGRTILDMANNCYLYVEYSDSPLAIDGVISRYPKGSYWCKLVLEDYESNTPATKIQQDYDYVKNNWARWEAEYGI